jgi:hypothetical protein
LFYKIYIYISLVSKSFYRTRAIFALVALLIASAFLGGEGKVKVVFVADYGCGNVAVFRFKQAIFAV